MQEDQKDFAFKGYEEYWNSADKKGYSGTLVYTRMCPSTVMYDIANAIDNSYQSSRDSASSFKHIPI